MPEPIARSPLSTEAVPGAWARGRDIVGGSATVSDETGMTMWRAWSGSARPGTAIVEEGRTEFSTSPGELTVIAGGPVPDEAVDLTHVRVSLRLTGSPDTLMKLTALDLTEEMFPVLSAARTLVAGITTEIVRDTPTSYLVIASRSFGVSLAHAIAWAIED